MINQRILSRITELYKLSEEHLLFEDACHMKRGLIFKRDNNGLYLDRDTSLAFEFFKIGLKSAAAIRSLCSKDEQRGLK